MISLHWYIIMPSQYHFILQEGFTNCLSIHDNINVQVIKHAIVWIALRNLKEFDFLSWLLTENVS